LLFYFLQFDPHSFDLFFLNFIKSIFQFNLTLQFIFSPMIIFFIIILILIWILLCNWFFSWFHLLTFDLLVIQLRTILLFYIIFFLNNFYGGILISWFGSRVLHAFYEYKFFLELFCLCLIFQDIILIHLFFFCFIQMNFIFQNKKYG
jgi:hypothetical protein